MTQYRITISLLGLVFASASSPADTSADEVPSAPKLVKEGNELLREGKHAEALRKYDAANEALPEAAEVAYNRGIALYNLGEFDKAETALQDALRPGDPELEAKAKYSLGRCAQANGLEIAAKMQNPDEGETALNDLARAIRFYDEALKLMPEDRAAVKNKEAADRLIQYLEKRLDLMREQQDKEKEKDDQNPTSQPTSQPTSKPSSRPTSQPDPNQPQEGENEQQEQEQQQQQENQGQQGEQKQDDRPSEQEENRQMSAEEAERFLQQARDAERDRREDMRKKAIRMRGRIPVKKDW